MWEGYRMSNDVVEILRGLNLFLGVVTLIWLLNRRVFNRKLYSGDVRKDTWLISFCWAAAVITGSIEQLWNTGTFVRVGLATVALLVTVRLLWRRQSEWDRTWLEQRGEEGDQSEKENNRP